ncbi:MAG TPA: LysR family transcriptional regulator [Polyangiales bacterium]
MTLEQLAAFQAVAHKGTFAAASQHVHKSQPAVTKLVQNLEEELGVALFDRSGYRVSLTDAGRLFLERTTPLLNSSAALRSFGRSLAGNIEPVLKLVVEAITPLPLLLTVLRDVEQQFPGVRYELQTERLMGALEALQDQTVDLVIAPKHGAEGHNIEARPFHPVRILPVVRHDHPLAAVAPPVPAPLLRSYAQVVLRDSARGEPTQNVNVLEGGLRWSVTDVAAKLEIIHAGMGWGGLPEHVVAAALRAGSLRTLEIEEFEVRVMPLFAMRRRDRARGPAGEALWERLGPGLALPSS